MPKEVFGRDYQFLEHDHLLSFEEITRLVRIFVSLGGRKVRVTGGEPLLRRQLPRLIETLADMPDLEDLTLTTNGVLLPQYAQALANAGLQRVTVSLDSLDDAIFQAMNDAGITVDQVLEGIEAAAKAGLKPIKINTVVKRGVNDQAIVDLARHFHGSGHIVRFIEFMDVGTTNGWRLDDVVPACQIVDRINADLPIEPLDPNYQGEVARRWRYRDGGGEIGVIASVSEPFCSNCTRARLSADGKFYTCLFASEGHDLRALLRSGASENDLTQSIRSIWRHRTDRYSQLRTAQTLQEPKVEMSYIGG
jgi:cyclic pyranopterin phosphate synthase